MSEQPQLAPPNPVYGWAKRLSILNDAIAIPPTERSFLQKAGVLHADGTYCEKSALWRKAKPITVAPDMPSGPVEYMAGRWVWGGVLWRHFGHFVVESTGRLWGLSTMNGDIDGVVFAPKNPNSGTKLAGFQKDFLNMAGAKQVKVLERPVRIERLIVPGQGFGIGDISAGTERCRAFFRTDFARDIKPNGPRRLYLSRSRIGPSRGALVCEDHIEQLLADQGYEIFHPQEHSLPQQVARYKAADTIIASEGSALHMLAHVLQPHQAVAMLVRRRSKATKYISGHIESFSGRAPLIVEHVKQVWYPEGQRRPRFARSELDMRGVQIDLVENGFIDRGAPWPQPSEETIIESLSSHPRAVPYRAAP